MFSSNLCHMSMCTAKAQSQPLRPTPTCPLPHPLVWLTQGPTPSIRRIHPAAPPTTPYLVPSVSGSLT